jgi:hypothetical protein
VASTAAANAALVEVDSEFYAELVVPAARLSADAVVTATPILCPVKVELISKIRQRRFGFSTHNEKPT